MRNASDSDGEDGNDGQSGIPQFFWAQNNKTLLYVQDNDGDENFRRS